MEIWKNLYQDGEFDGIESDTIGPVKPDWWNPLWIPFTNDGAGNHYCIDLDPAPDGAVGQVLEFWHDESERRVVATSISEFLSGYIGEVLSGQVSFNLDFDALIRQTKE